jgi:hypothetical protein
MCPLVGEPLAEEVERGGMKAKKCLDFWLG